jgi:hypothetical protein
MAFGEAAMIEFEGFFRQIHSIYEADLHPSSLVVTWNREAQLHPNLAHDILPWRNYIKLEIDKVSGAEIHFWPSIRWILDRHG